jgi:hypothetical protein
MDSLQVFIIHCRQADKICRQQCCHPAHCLLNRSFDPPTKIFDLLLSCCFLSVASSCLKEVCSRSPQVLAISGLANAKQAGVRHADPVDGTGLIPFVASESPPALSKVKTWFGHQVTKANAKHHGASTQFYLTLADDLLWLKAETTDWNPPAEANSAFPVSRMHKLCFCPIGGVLMAAVLHWNSETASFGDPVVQVVASPAVAPLGKSWI